MLLFNIYINFNVKLLVNKNKKITDKNMSNLDNAYIIQHMNIMEKDG